MSYKYYKLVLNILCDLICDVISCCVLSSDAGKINVGYSMTHK